MPFAVVLGIDLTEIFDLILFLGANHQHVLLWSLQQSRSFFSRFLYFASVMDFILIYEHSPLVNF